jgi:hypothetical protein
MEVNGQLHVLAALFPEKEPPEPLDWKLDGIHSRSGRGDGLKNTIIASRRELNPGHPACKLVSVVLHILMFNFAEKISDLKKRTAKR